MFLRGEVVYTRDCLAGYSSPNTKDSYIISCQHNLWGPSYQQRDFNPHSTAPWHPFSHQPLSLLSTHLARSRVHPHLHPETATPPAGPQPSCLALPLAQGGCRPPLALSLPSVSAALPFGLSKPGPSAFSTGTMVAGKLQAFPPRKPPGLPPLTGGVTCPMVPCSKRVKKTSGKAYVICDQLCFYFRRLCPFR